MGRDRSRIVASLVGYLVLVIASAIVMDWFEMSMGALGKVGIGLHSVTACRGGVCTSVSFGNLALRGSFPLVAAITFWGSLLTAVLVTFQAGSRLLSGVASESLSDHGIKACVVMILGALVAGFVFGPQGGAAELGVTFERTWAPLMLVGAHVLGAFTLRFAVTESQVEDVGPYVPIKIEGRPQPEHPVGAAPTPEPEVVVERPSTGPMMTMPDHLRKKISYLTITAEITRGGIDARREDGSSKLVMWRDVVGVVARRLPPEHEGATFVDLVSTAGETLRVLPWTRLSGEPLPGTGDGRARALVSLVLTHCPEITVDPKTQKFVEGKEAAQLPDAATLAAHDARLA